jgi:hypothetical protein
MKELIKKTLNENVTKSDVKDEFKIQIDSTTFKKKIEKIIADKLKDDKDLEDKVVEISKNVLTQLYKTLWTKKSFWRDSLSNKNA